MSLIKKEDYRHSFVVNYMDLDDEVLLKKEFWDLIGQEEIHGEILGIYQKIRREKGSDMLDQLALGY